MPAKLINKKLMFKKCASLSCAMFDFNIMSSKRREGGKLVAGQTDLPAPQSDDVLWCRYTRSFFAGKALKFILQKVLLQTSFTFSFVYPSNSIVTLFIQQKRMKVLCTYAIIKRFLKYYMRKTCLYKIFSDSSFFSTSLS